MATALSFAVLVVAFVRVPRRRPFGVPGWLGLFVSCSCGALLVAPAPEPVFLVALAWTGLILAVDSAVHSIRGRSLIRSSPAAFVWLVMLSILLWLPFEWFNLRLAGWYRSGLPGGLIRYPLLGWFSACIWPALFEMADFFMTLTGATARHEAKPVAPQLGHAIPAVVLGSACLAMPLLVPRLDFGEHLFPLASVGFLLLLDPLNLVAGRPSVWGDWRSGNRARTLAVALAGVFCGLVADSLNHLADAKWHSIYRIGSELSPFELPAGAYLALPLFALQAFAMHSFVTGALDLPRPEIPTVPADEATEGPFHAAG